MSHRKKMATKRRHYLWKAGRATALELHIGASKFTAAGNEAHKTRKMGKFGAASQPRSLTPAEIAELGYEAAPND